MLGARVDLGGMVIIHSTRWTELAGHRTDAGQGLRRSDEGSCAYTGIDADHHPGCLPGAHERRHASKRPTRSTSPTPSDASAQRALRFVLRTLHGYRKDSMKLKQDLLPFMALISTFLLAACNGNGELRSGAYVIDSVETIEASALPDMHDTLQADLLESREHSWLVLDTATRTVQYFTPGNDEPAKGELSEGLDELHTDRGETLPLEQLGRDRFALTMSLFGEYRLVYRWVEDDSAELAQIRAEREAVMRRKAERLSAQKAHLRALADETVELNLRQSLPAGEVSIALPADASLGEDPRFGYRLLWTGVGLNNVNILALPSASRGEDMAAHFEQERQRFRQFVPVRIAMDEDTFIGIDDFGEYRLLARAEQGEYTVIMQAEVGEQEFPTLMSIWRSLDAPVDEVQFLRTPEVALPEHLIGQDEFNQRIAEAFARQIRPSTLLERRRLHPGVSASFAPSPIGLQENIEPHRQSTLNVHPELFEGNADTVLQAFAPRRLSERTGIDFIDGWCVAYAAIEADLGVADRPYTLLLRQQLASSYANCLATAVALEHYDLKQRLSGDIAPALLDHFAAYRLTSPTTRGDIRVMLDGHRWGVISNTGQTIAPAEYDDIDSGSDAGYILTRDGKKGFVAPDGELILPVIHDGVAQRGDAALVARKDGKWAAYTTDGTQLLEPEYDQIHTAADGRALHVHQGKLRALYDLQARHFSLPLSKELTSINEIGDELFITQGINGAGLYSISGEAVIEEADNIIRIRTRPMVAVRMEKGGNYRFHDLDGQLLSDAEYSAVWPNYSAGRISVRDTDGRSFYIDFDLNRRTPEGLVAVYAPTEGGYTVVADGNEPPMKYGMTGPDDELVLPVEFRRVFTMQEGLITAQAQNGLWGIWNKTGEQVLAPEWQTMGQSYGGKIYARRDDLWRVINRQGESLDDRRWSTLLFVSRNLVNHPPFVAARIASEEPDAGDRWEILDLQGERLVDGTFDAVTQSEFGVQVTRDGEQLKYPDDFQGRAD